MSQPSIVPCRLMRNFSRKDPRGIPLQVVDQLLRNARTDFDHFFADDLAAVGTAIYEGTLFG